jgi:hypothetical protein
MALAKSRSAITQVTATGNSTTLSLSTAYEAAILVRHVNGTGTISAQGVADVEVRSSGGSTWFTLTTLGFGTTASAAVERVVDIPPGCDEVRLAYTSPTGSTGHTLDAEVATITGV